MEGESKTACAADKTLPGCLVVHAAIDTSTGCWEVSFRVDSAGTARPGRVLCVWQADKRCSEQVAGCARPSTQWVLMFNRLRDVWAWRGVSAALSAEPAGEYSAAYDACTHARGEDMCTRITASPDTMPAV